MTLSTVLLWLLLVCLGALYILVLVPDDEPGPVEGNGVFTATALAVAGLAVVLATILSGVAG